MRTVYLIISILCLFAVSGFAEAIIPDIDRVRIAEAFRIGEKLQNEFWPSWSSARSHYFSLTDDQEFLIRHPKPNDEFRSIGYDKMLKSEAFVRPRKFQKDFLATFPAFGMGPVIVVGKAENTSDKTSTRWVFVVMHEHFHQLQYSRPNYFDDVNALNLVYGDTTGMWQINFPFPYKQQTIDANFRDLTSQLLAAYESKDGEDRPAQKLNSYLEAH